MEHADKQLLEAMRRIKAYIGNVDLTEKGHVVNAARMRGDMLNRIRKMADASIRAYVTRKQISLLQDGIQLLEENPEVSAEIHGDQIKSLVTDMRKELGDLQLTLITVLV